MQGCFMKKSDKINIINALIERADNLVYVFNSQSQIPVKNDALSFVSNVLEEKKAIRWEKEINDIYWGLTSVSSAEAEQNRSMRWYNGKEKLIGILESIKQEIELYTSDDVESTTSTDNTVNNDPIIFLSHSSADKSYADALEVFITSLGVKREQLIYTSHPMHKIPLDENIFDYLRKNFHRKFFTIFLWSDKYLDSPACLNEMGATWVTQSDYSHIFTPNFDFGNPKFHECAVDTRKMGAVLNGNDNCKTSMIEFKHKILTLFGLSIDEIQVNHLLDEFIKKVLDINNRKSATNNELDIF